MIDENAVTPVTKWLVAGIGSRLGRDDAIGLQLVTALSNVGALAVDCILLENSDATTIAASLLEWQRPILFVDAADMGLDAGEHRFFDEGDARLQVRSDSASTHGMGLADGLALARELGYGAPVRFFGIQPFDLSPRPGLTDEMTARESELLAALRQAAVSLLDLTR